MAETPLSTVQTAYAAFGRGDIPALLACWPAM
jgi:ketosteroid isomerase-like protein